MEGEIIDLIIFFLYGIPNPPNGKMNEKVIFLKIEFWTICKEQGKDTRQKIAVNKFREVAVLV